VIAGTALLAAAGGLYSVLTYAVGRRRRENGIRSALGASPRQIQRVVLQDGAMVAAVGIAFGAVTAWAFGRVLASLQYGVTLADPVTWITVLVVLTSATVAASWRPARQAMRVDPASLLREE
jgi:putative ABC transport system permease protein